MKATYLFNSTTWWFSCFNSVGKITCSCVVALKNKFKCAQKYMAAENRAIFLTPWHFFSPHSNTADAGDGFFSLVILGGLDKKGLKCLCARLQVFPVSWSPTSSVCLAFWGDDTWCVQKECVLPTGVTPDLASVNTTGPDVLARARRDTPHHHRLCLLTCSRRYNMHPVEQQRYALVTVFHYSGSCKHSELFSLTS